MKMVLDLVIEMAMVIIVMKIELVMVAMVLGWRWC